MAGFGVVWAAIFIIIITPLLGGLLTKIAFNLTENEVKIRKKERRYASYAKDNSLSMDSSLSSKISLSNESTLRSRHSSLSQRRLETQSIRSQITGIVEELNKLNNELEERFETE